VSTKKEVESKDTLRFTRISKLQMNSRTSLLSQIMRQGRTTFTDWNWVKVVGHKTDRRTRWIKEAIGIHKHKGRAMNRDVGSYFLSSTNDKLLLRDSARFYQNDTSRRRVNTCTSVPAFLRKMSADIETSI